MQSAPAAIATLAAILIACTTAYAISCGQFDNFENGTTMGWQEGATSPNPPTNVPNGGPAGSGDNYLRNVSSGGSGPGAKMTMFNTAQWSGNYRAAGVGRIEADMANFGSTTLHMRIAMESSSAQFCSMRPELLPPDGQWYHVSFNLSSADMTRVQGGSSLATALNNILTMRIISAAAGPSWNGDVIAGVLGVDNIAAKVIGDCDLDGDVDNDDYTIFESCLEGPGGGLATNCGCIDFDCDHDVDLRDFQEAQ